MPGDALEPFVFSAVARVAAPGDNVAIALQTLPAGSRILIRQLVFEFAHTVLEGHRFAIHRIRKGEALLSWGLPFGLALRDIEPGEYVCNEKILRSLAERTVDAVLPKNPNFADHRLPFQLDETRFRPGEQVRAIGPSPVFHGFRRSSTRGVGTRNYVVVLGTNSRTAGFARSVAQRFLEISQKFPNIDGVVAIDHTEGGSDSAPKNLDLTLRTLAGFSVNPNVGAVLCVDYGGEILSNAALQAYLDQKNYPTAGLLLGFYSIGATAFEQALDDAAEQVRRWLPEVNQCQREPISAAQLKLGLQCGGSDAFSGISANPLVGILSRQIVAFGGGANLAETDELIGAETYVLQNVRDLATAQRFLRTRDRFQEWASWHGHSAEGNPSGGNMFRGLYNITIKSIGAARKKDPATRLDHVIDFGELMPNPGFYFMDSPGNDLESIAGQVASGCNLILFATGNGSITNFPFVPTIKLMTTSRRFELVRNEMDFNAGRYLDGESMESLGHEAFDQMLRIASGEKSAGERAGHSQVQLWREWRGGPLELKSPDAAPLGNPSEEAPLPAQDITSIGIPRSLASPAAAAPVALVLPTSLCSGQIAAMIAAQLNRAQPGLRVIALPHTEGCGNSAGDAEQLFLRTMAGYLAHPLVGRAVLLEHGCEKTHNDAFRHFLRDLNVSDSHYGFASIQLDGGIEKVTGKVMEQLSTPPPRTGAKAPFGIGIVAEKTAPLERAVINLLLRSLADAGITTVAPEGLSQDGHSIRYGERFLSPGRYSMTTPTADLTEIITGLGATGVQLILAFASHWLIPANPLVPTLQIAAKEILPSALQADVDILYSLQENTEQIVRTILNAAADIRSGQKTPRNAQLRNTAFQVTRGFTGISL